MSHWQIDKYTSPEIPYTTQRLLYSFSSDGPIDILTPLIDVSISGCAGLATLATRLFMHQDKANEASGNRINRSGHT